MAHPQGGNAGFKAPGWFVSTWAVLTVGVVYGMTDGQLDNAEALTALGLAAGWAAMRGLFLLLPRVRLRRGEEAERYD
jgi:hypothetical protein